MNFFTCFLRFLFFILLFFLSLGCLRSWFCLDQSRGLLCLRISRCISPRIKELVDIDDILKEAPLGLLFWMLLQLCHYLLLLRITHLHKLNEFLLLLNLRMRPGPHFLFSHQVQIVSEVSRRSWLFVHAVNFCRSLLGTMALNAWCGGQWSRPAIDTAEKQAYN